MCAHLSYFSIALKKKHHNEGNLRKKHLIWDSWFQKVRLHDYHGEELGGRQAEMVLEQ